MINTSNLVLYLEKIRTCQKWAAVNLRYELLFMIH